MITDRIADGTIVINRGQSSDDKLYLEFPRGNFHVEVNRHATDEKHYSVWEGDKPPFAMSETEFIASDWMRNL